MNQVRDREKKRRQYLRRLGEAYISAAIAGALFVPTLLITIASVIATISCAVLFVFHLCMRDGSADYWLSFLMPFGGSAFVVGLFTCALWSALKYAKREVSIPYVPPVTASTLPAEDILVRGADEPPTAHGEVLVRAARHGQETPKEELLRVRPGESRD